jgi:hypothetical protein
MSYHARRLLTLTALRHHTLALGLPDTSILRQVHVKFHTDQLKVPVIPPRSDWYHIIGLSSGRSLCVLVNWGWVCVDKGS